MIKYIAALAFLLSVSVAADTVDQFKQANNYYQDQKYDSASAAYESILNGGTESASIYFNLGNAYFKQGDMGRAVLNYLRAERLDPDDPDIKENLDLARQYTRVHMEGVELNPISSLIDSIVAPYRLSTMGWVSSALFILFIIALILRFGLAIRGTAVRSMMTVSLLLLILAGGLTTFKYRHDYLSRRAVIVAEDSSVRTGPSDHSEIELEASPGLVVEIIDESSEYYQVLFENKRRGWLNKAAVVEI